MKDFNGNTLRKGDRVNVLTGTSIHTSYKRLMFGRVESTTANIAIVYVFELNESRTFSSVSIVKPIQ